MIQPPCYDTVKKMDCPERSRDCHTTCKRWADYVKERNSEYEKKSLAVSDSTDGKIRTIRRFINRNRGRGHGGSLYKERQE